MAIGDYVPQFGVDDSWVSMPSSDLSVLLETVARTAEAGGTLDAAIAAANVPAVRVPPPAQAAKKKWYQQWYVWLIGALVGGTTLVGVTGGAVYLLMRKPNGRRRKR